MWLVPVAILFVVFAFLLVRVTSGPPRDARLVVIVANGVLQERHGNLGALARSLVTDIVREEKIVDGWIAINQEGRVVFSKQFPESCHQSVRNVLLN